MATTYEELKAEVQTWLDNDNPNLVAAIPTFIQDAEKWIGRHLHTRDMECIAPTPLVPDGVTEDTLGVYDVPSDWGGSKSVSIKRDATNGDQLILHYWAKIPALSDTVTTNWLLDKYPDLYRYASLSSAEPFLKNDERTGLWASKAGQIMQEVEAHDEHDLFSGGPLRSRVDRPWVGDGAPGRLEYMAPFDFCDMVERGTLATATCAGWFTLTQNQLRIWPKPAMPTP